MIAFTHDADAVEQIQILVRKMHEIVDFNLNLPGVSQARISPAVSSARGAKSVRFSIKRKNPPLPISKRYVSGDLCC